MGIETIAAIASIGAAGFSTYKALTQKAPKVDTAPATNELAAAQTSTANARTALLETAGGQAGAILQPGQVGNSDRLFGN